MINKSPYIDMIILSDPIVEQFSAQLEKSENGAGFIKRTTDLLRDKIKFDNTVSTGYTPFEVVLELKRGNCLSLSCLLCSILRANGIGPDEVMVVIGGDKGFYWESIHAWTAIRTDDSLIIIDPVNMLLDKIDIIREKSLYLFFNDKTVISGAGVKIESII